MCVCVCVPVCAWVCVCGQVQHSLCDCVSRTVVAPLCVCRSQHSACVCAGVDPQELQSMRHQLEDAQRWNASLQARLGAIQNRAAGVGGANDTGILITWLHFPHSLILNAIVCNHFSLVLFAIYSR